MNTVLQWIGTVGIFLTGLAAFIGVIRTGRVHKEVTTGNGRTLGETVTAGAKDIEAVKEAVVDTEAVVKDVEKP